MSVQEVQVGCGKRRRHFGENSLTVLAVGDAIRKRLALGLRGTEDDVARGVGRGETARTGAVR